MSHSTYNLTKESQKKKWANVNIVVVKDQKNQSDKHRLPGAITVIRQVIL